MIHFLRISHRREMNGENDGSISEKCSSALPQLKMAERNNTSFFIFEWKKYLTVLWIFLPFCGTSYAGKWNFFDRTLDFLDRILDFDRTLEILSYLVIL